ncbi:MAG: alpha-amylase, partial [Burkholderiales bacterium]|nr:alpha-amylase [Burkholderiales bacterium]
PGSFADNPIVYFVITDRFVDGNPANDHAYGRRREPDARDDIATFHGGDLAGLTRKVRQGWFSQLGVNAIWITAPYEQIHGWVVGGNKQFKHYAYHGYYALDYTRLDRSMGTEDELREFVGAAHGRGIRVLFDVVMNHPGYADIADLAEYVGPVTDRKVGVLWKGYERATPADYHSWIDYNDPAWLNWWGPDWVRAGLRGYTEGGSDDYTRQLAYLPDFKTESPRFVGLPPLLRHKPDTAAKALPHATVRDYLVGWLTQWVRDYGIDGFRCDTVKNVEPASWTALKAAGLKALAAWKAAHAGAEVDDAPFWMTGEYWGHGIQRDALFDAGFDNMINFDFQARASAARRPADLEPLFSEYAKALAAPANYNVLSYISSHDTALFDRKRLIEGAEALLLAPGGVQIFYGDETARAPGPFFASDPQQATRSDMNWGAIDTAVLAHWRKLGSFRARHVALARGRHAKLADAPYTFSRRTADDRVIVALGAQGTVSLPVAGLFADGSKVHDAYGGTTATVLGGSVTIAVDPAGVVLLESAR